LGWAFFFVALTSCSSNEAPRALEWVSASHAYLECKTVHAVAKAAVTQEASAPRDFPAGFYLGDFVSSAAHLVGFAPESKICALELSTALEDEVDEFKRRAQTLERTLAHSFEEMRDIDDCACRWAFEDGIAKFSNQCTVQDISQCREKSPTNADYVRIRDKIVTAAKAAFLPPRHWRMVGTFDRPHAFSEAQTRLIQGIKGSTTIAFRRSKLMKNTANEKKDAPELERLLELPHVVAAAMQNQGLAHLVVRQMPGNVMIFDYFESRAQGVARVELERQWADLTVNWIAERLPQKPATSATINPRTEFMWTRNEELTKVELELDNVRLGAAHDITDEASALPKSEATIESWTLEIDPDGQSGELRVKFAQPFGNSFVEALASESPRREAVDVLEEFALAPKKTAERRHERTTSSRAQASNLARALVQCMPAKTLQASDGVFRWTLDCPRSFSLSPSAAFGVATFNAPVEAQLDPSSGALALHLRAR
jgi:hypothetical protein